MDGGSFGTLEQLSGFKEQYHDAAPPAVPAMTLVITPPATTPPLATPASQSATAGHVLDSDAGGHPTYV